MQTRLKRFWALLLSFALFISMMPGMAAAAASVPFSAAVGGENVTEMAEDTVTWTDWEGNSSELPRYTVTVPQGAAEAVLTFASEMQVAYYSSTGTWLGYVGGDASMPAAATHTVAIQDSNSDGELDGISVQIPNTYLTNYYIQFVYASAEQTSCLTVREDAPVTGTVSAGGLYQLNLNTVFSDSENHSLTYSFETTVENEHTKIADGVFYFSTSEKAAYDVTLTAKCEEAEISHKLTITAEEASEGIEAQYGYDETAKSSVTVYVTLSNDGYPIVAADGTVMSHLEVTVPYFDLGLYGLEQYYRYGTDGGSGPYTNDTIIQRPTGLHLYIYLLERYYMGLEEGKCCLGTSGVLEYAENTEVYFMDGELAYENDGKRALYTSGGATSIYMVNFWGHDENLMYYRNHCYPYMSAGWGATSDYILLSDGDTWDVAMFSNWSFHNSGFFACFDQDSYTVAPGESVTAATRKWGTSSAATDFENVNGLTVGLYDSEWKLIEELSYDSEAGNSLTFTAPETAGTYYLMALDPNAKDTVVAKIAPATARLTVGSTESGDEAAVSRILLNTYSEELVYNNESGNTLQLTATVLPAEAAGRTILWTSSNEAVATVDQNGLVTAVGAGDAVITAAIGDIKAECAITSVKYNTAPAVVSGAASRAKIKINTSFELDVAALFTDEQGDALTYTAEVCEASGLASDWNYSYTAIEGFDTAVTDGKVSVTFPETGIYAVKVTASDGELETTFTYQFTVVDNDAGVIQLNDGVYIDFYNIVVVASGEEYVEDYDIPYKGTHDTVIHHIVLSKDTVSGTPNRRMDFVIAEGFGWSQYSGTPTQDASWSTRADIGLFAYDASGTMTAHYLQFHTECKTHTDENKDLICDVCTMDLSCETCMDENSDRVCDVCGKDLNNVPVLAEGAEDLTVQIQTGFSYQLEDLMDGKIFTDPDGDTLTYASYFYRKSSDGGVTWGELTGFTEMEHGGINSSLGNSTAGTYIYEFVACDGYGYSVDTWTLTLQVMDVVPANVSFYVGRDQNYSVHSIYPVLELYRTAGIDENLYDYVGWFTNPEGKTEYVYNPADYEIIDGEMDYVVIDGVQYELHDYEKIVFTNSAFDDSDTTATASGTLAGNYNMFYASIETGRYSTRAYGWNAETSAYDIYLGGQSLELPMEKDIYGGGGGDIYLRVVTGYTTSKKLDGTYFTAEDYRVEMIMPITGGMIHAGDPYVNGNYTYFPFLSYAAGNASLYNVYAYPTDTENYIFNQSINNTTPAGYTVVNKSVKINTAVILTVTVPESAHFDLYFQYNNFNTKAVEPEGEAVVNGDGTKTITYKVSKGSSNYTWRLTDPSGMYVTKAGWLASLTAAAEKTYTFAEGDATNKTSHDFSNLGTAVKTRDEADIQVFLDHDGFMSTTGTYRIRAFRMWQLINSDTANIMVEPDFNIQVLQGNASDISLVNGGNANDNWIDVTPSTTDIIAVNYDAIDMYSTADNYGSHGGLFPATAPERTGVFVITNEAAGTADAVVSFNGGTDTDRGSEWDYNYDTWYYMNTDTAPTLDFTVTSSGDVTVSYAVVTTNSALESTLSDWTSVSADAEGYYHADLLKFRNAGTLGGTVIIKMTDSTGTSYRLVRVGEMTVTLTNTSNPGEPFMPGDEVTVTFDGLFRAVNKVAGIFNPLTYYLRYTVGETEVNGKLGQYQQMDRTSVTLTIPEDITFPEGESSVDYTFTNGYIYGSMYSASSPFDTLYNMTDTGVGTNFSAVGVSFVLSRMADIPVTVEQRVYYDVKLVVSDGETVMSDYTLTLTDPDGDALTPDENGIYQDLPYGQYPYTLAKAGYIGQNGSIKIGSADAQSVVDGVLTKTIVIVKAAENAWDGATVAEPKTDENGVYLIGTGAELAWFAQTVNAGTTGIKGVLTADIDLACYNWTPIGTSSNKFAGSFDGQGHKIYNLSILSTAATANQGLFGYVNGSADARVAISNLTVEGEIDLTNASSVSQANVGSIVGCGLYVDITNVHTDVDIAITRVKGNWARVGGIIGSANYTVITDSSNTGNISGYQYVGGIAGYETSESTITGCYNSGNISGYQNIGGIAGSNAGSVIRNSYNTGDVSCTGNNVGGIAGGCAGASVVLSNCFTTGTVTYSGSTVYAGAVTGQVNKAEASVSDVYYLETAYTVGIGKITGEHTVTAVSAETLSSAAFISTMNNGLETPAFKAGNDHPLLVWQVRTENPQVSVSADTTALNPGDEIIVTIRLDHAIDDVMLAEFYLHYDTSLFTRGAAVIGDALTGTQVSDKNISADGTELKNDGTDDAVQKFSINVSSHPDGHPGTPGAIVTIRFTAKQAIQVETAAQFKLECAMVQDRDYADAAVDVSEPLEVTIAACGHNWVDATCTAPKTCPLCGATEGEALGHSFTDYVSNNDANCTEDGTETAKCDRCDETHTRTAKGSKLAHTEAEPVRENEMPATCTEAGSYDEVVYCDLCDEELSRTTKTTAALGHKDEDKDHKCDTCQEVLSECKDENKDYICDICGAELEKPEEPANDEVIRLAGAHRWETAIKVADEMKANLGVEKFNTIIIASGNDFADALAGSYLSTVKSAPILLSWGQGGRFQYLDEDNIAYIKANLAEGGTVYILGGEKAVPASYEEALKDYNVVRLGGANRFETNLLILAEAGVNKGDEILVCTSTNFADSLSASATGKPILLVFNNYKALYGEQPEYLATLEDCTFTIVGGESAVCAELETAVKTYGETTRLAGENRFETSVMVAEKYFENPETAVLAYAWNYPDGLCGGALAYSMDAPLILTMTKYEAEAVAYATENSITSGVVLGGDGLISDDAVRSIFAMDPEAEIIVK